MITKTGTSHDLIRNRPRREQHLALPELRQSSRCISRLWTAQYFIRSSLYFLLLWFGLDLLQPRLGTFWFIAIAVGIIMLVDELFWRFVMVPIMDRERERLTTTRQDTHEAQP